MKHHSLITKTAQNVNAQLAESRYIFLIEVRRRVGGLLIFVDNKQPMFVSFMRYQHLTWTILVFRILTTNFNNIFQVSIFIYITVLH